jgi:hypothetical protein
MKNQASGRTARIAILAAATAMIGYTVSQADEPPPATHYSGLINDYTPSAAVVKGGPYEMRGKWSLEVDERHGTARFSAEMNMETSDFGITQGTVDKDNPTTRGAHTHHIVMTDGMVSSDWMSRCPSFAPPVTGGFVITGSAFVTGNGSPALFGNPSQLTLCILGGANVEFSNLTMTFGTPANTHFGIQAIHGVVVRCAGPWGLDSKECKVE